MLWEVDEHATLFIEPSPARAGAGRITFAVTALDKLLERLAAQRIHHEPIETYSNGVRHVNVPDPDGNTVALAEPPDAENATPRSVQPPRSRSRQMANERQWRRRANDVVARPSSSTARLRAES